LRVGWASNIFGSQLAISHRASNRIGHTRAAQPRTRARGESQIGKPSHSCWWRRGDAGDRAKAGGGTQRTVAGTIPPRSSREYPGRLHRVSDRAGAAAGLPGRKNWQKDTFDRRPAKHKYLISVSSFEGRPTKSRSWPPTTGSRGCRCVRRAFTARLCRSGNRRPLHHGGQARLEIGSAPLRRVAGRARILAARVWADVGVFFGRGSSGPGLRPAQVGLGLTISLEVGYFGSPLRRTGRTLAAPTGSRRGRRVAATVRFALGPPTGRWGFAGRARFYGFRRRVAAGFTSVGNQLPDPGRRPAAVET